MGSVVEYIRVRRAISMEEIRAALYSEERMGKQPCVLLSRTTWWWSHRLCDAAIELHNSGSAPPGYVHVGPRREPLTMHRD